jgi:uncharacterized protein (TIGR02996 family)
MWVATTADEAHFIFDLLADPNASGPVLEYARWLEERGEARAAEFLRLALSPQENRERLTLLRGQLDAHWLRTVTSRWFRRGDVVRITGGQFRGIEGSVREVEAAHGRVGLLLHMFYRPTDLTWVDFTDLELQRHTRQGEPED